MRLIPDWYKPHSLVFVWPQGLKFRKSLISFYTELIRKLPAELNLTLIAKSHEIMISISQKLKQVNPNISISYHVVEYLEDIWIRDWAPFIGIDETADKIAFKAIYDPIYGDDFLENDNKAGYELIKLFNYKRHELNLIWDGGNLTQNGKGSCIITERLRDDNSAMDPSEFYSDLNETGLFDFKFVSEEPEDVTGHVDGMIRFLDEETLLIAAYPDKYKENENVISEDDYEFSYRFMNDMANLFKDDYKIIRVVNAIPSSYEDPVEMMPSAFGNYVNFLRLGDKVLIPQYGIKEDEAAFKVFADYFGADNVIKISYDVDKLAHLGGVLNCISWVAF